MVSLNLQRIPELVNRKVEERFSKIQGKIVESIKAEMELVEFEILCSLLVKPQKELHKALRENRNAAWKEALKKAKGNRKKAIEIFCEEYP